MATISTRMESKRGCGYRKAGGTYLVSGGLLRPCGRLPIPLEVCPTCNNGVKPARGWTWINFAALAEPHPCSFGPDKCRGCLLAPAANTCDGWELGRCGLIWVGEAFYKTPGDFTREAIDQGVSRRVTGVPRDFKVGETVVLFAHRKAIENPDGSFTAGIFHGFRPTAVEYVVKGDETDDELDAMEARGLTLVRVVPVDEHGNPIDQQDADRLSDKPVEDDLPLFRDGDDEDQ